MKLIFSLLLTGLSLSAYADIITLKDGTKVEGTVEGEMDGVLLIKTKYGALNINRADIASQSPQAAPTASTSSVAGELPPAELPARPARELIHIFTTVTASTSSFERIYFENGVVIATETLDSKGELLGLQGFIKDGTYREYYANGGLKTEKTVINSEITGTLKAYYPNGVLRSEAVYANGVLSGPLRIYNDSAKLLFEQNFKNGVANGWFREYDESGALRSELFYANGQVAEKPKTAEAVKPAAEAAEAAAPESPVTAKTQKLARGERFTFLLNNKYVAKVQLDKDYNIILKEGAVPDGTVKVYNKEGKLEKEFVFVKNEILLMKMYGETGALMGSLEYSNDKARKK